MTEKKITLERTVRFNGKHCDSECDFLAQNGGGLCFECRRGYDKNWLEWDEDKRGGFIGAVRSEYCIIEFGLFGEDQKIWRWR